MTSSLSQALGGKADLLARLAEDPSLATPRLARELWQRVVDLHRTDARAARELAECAWIVAERAGDQSSRALAHRALALAALAAGRQRDVLSHYEAAERLHLDMGDEVERARVLRSMIDPLMHLGRYDEALASGEEAVEILMRHDERLLAAQVEANVGNVHHRLGRDAESLDAYGRALSTFRKLGDLDAAAVVEFNRANVFAGRSDLEEAERGYRRALRHYRARGERLRENQCRYQLAYLDFLAGRYSDALRGIEAVRNREQELGDERHAALATLDEAELLLALNAWEEARDRAREARAALMSLGLAQDAILASLYLGLGALHLRRWGEAAELLAEARAGFRTEGNEVLAALADLYQAELDLRRGEPRAALGAARAAVRAFEARGLSAKEGYARIVAGRALLALHRCAFARRQAEAALDRLSRVPSAGIGWRAQALLADLAGDAVERRHRLEAAIEDADRLRARIVPDELQASFQRDKIDLYAALALGFLEAPADPAAAFDILESARSRVLADRLSAHTTGSAPPALRRTLDELGHLYRRLNEAERDDTSRASAEPLRGEIARREAEVAAHHRSASLAWGDQGVPRSDGGTLAAVSEILGSDEALVEFAVLERDLHAFVVDARGLRWTGPIGRWDAIEESLSQWLFQAGKTALGRGYLERHAGALGAGARSSLGKLYDLVWEPIRPLLDDATAITVVPSGPLFYLPFHALWDGRAHLIEAVEISTAPSARALAALDRRAGGNRTRSLVLGFEVEGLPGITREVEAVAAGLGDATVLTGHEATREALRRLGGDAAIVHLAAHAEFRSDNPLLSSIQLADGRLTFYDLFDLRWTAELVVLSGCQTGQSRVLEGDELMGLARGFQYAGVRALVASLWSIDDAAAAEFMRGFYGHMAAGRAPRAALAGAMRDGIAAGRLPHEWAPFFLSGGSSEGRPS